jgi:ankyrin repeat protein
MIASQNGHTEALALLLANGVNVNAAKQVIYNLNSISDETYNAFEIRMGGLPLCMPH